ncbi:hypothetical protein HN51_069897 [Arachis hypogaea]
MDYLEPHLMWKLGNGLNFHQVLEQIVPTTKGQALADEYGIKFFDTVSETNVYLRMLTLTLRRRYLNSFWKQNQPTRLGSWGRASSTKVGMLWLNREHYDPRIRRVKIFV